MGPARPRPLTAFLLLAGAVFAAFAPALGAGFLNFDDDRLLYRNPAFAGGASAALAAILDPTSTIAEVYLPASHLSLWADWLLFGENPAGAHLHSLLLHALSAWALFLLLGALGAAAWPALAGSLVFALHPALAESVAWASSRKDVLSGCLVLVSLLAGVRWLDRPSRALAAACVLAGVAALYAKGSAVVLPLLLAALAWQRSAPLRRVWPLLALLGLAALGAGAHHALLAAREGTAAFGAEGGRLAALPGTFFHYLRVAFHPVGLDVLYPTESTLEAFRAALLPSSVWLAAVLLLVAALARHGKRTAAAGLAWFLMALLPFNGVLPASSLAAADRYLYLPLAGLGVAASAAAGAFPRRLGGVLPFLCLAVVLGALAFHRTAAVFRDSESLWRASLAGGGPRPVAAFNLAGFLLARDGTASAEARELLERAAAEASQPVHLLRTHRLLSALAEEDGDLEGALAHRRSALGAAHALAPSPAAAALAGDVGAETALLLWRLERRQEASRELEEVLALHPRHPGATALAALLRVHALAEAHPEGGLDGDDPTALEVRRSLEEALRTHPGHLQLGLALGQWAVLAGRSVDALRVFRRLQERHPAEADAYLGAADAFESAGLPRGALEEVERGIRRAGARPRLVRRRGLLLAAVGELQEARRVLEGSLRLHPGEETVQRTLAALLAAEAETRLHRDPPDALSPLARRARELDPHHPRLDYVEGWLLRAEGRFAEAVDLLEKARARFPEDREVAVAHGETLKALGFQHLLAGRRSDALAVFARVARLDLPELDLGTIPAILGGAMRERFERGIRLFGAGAAEGAAAEFRAARELFPEHPDVLFNLGLATLETGPVEEALALLEAAEEAWRREGRDPGLPRLYRAKALEGRGAPEEAVRLVEAFLAERPDTAAAERLRAWLEARGGG